MFRFVLVLVILFCPTSNAIFTIDEESYPFIFENGEKCEAGTRCLQLTNETYFEGEDSLGFFNATNRDYISLANSRVRFQKRNYDEQNITVYKQEFFDDIMGTSTGDKDDVSTGYPVLLVPEEDEAENMRYVTPGEYMSGWILHSQGRFWDEYEKKRFRTGEQGGIVCLLDRLDSDDWSVVMSGLSQPMAINNKLDFDTHTDRTSLIWGVQGLAKYIPAGFSLEIIVSHGFTTFNENVMKWGSSILQYHGTVKIPDPSVNYLSYYTDNGAYHYYNPHPFDNYEDTLVDLTEHAKANGVPIRYLQLDSWWYHKGNAGGVKNWTAIPEVFPNGIQSLHNATGLPIVAHNRYFSDDTDYADVNGGLFPFAMDHNTGYSMPMEQSFWDFLFDEALEWGLAVYEQDWMDRQYENMAIAHTNITLAGSWLDNMAQSALERNINIQYCMSLPRQLLHSATLPAVTQIRLSDDYLLSENQWMIFHSSLFAHALGLKPHKDVFWSSPENPNNPYAYCETFEPFDPSNPVNLQSSYIGRDWFTASGDGCLSWKGLDYRAKYPHENLDGNYCRNPANQKDKAFCFTRVLYDTPESEWEWEYCDLPVCDIDCYVQFGYNYIGDMNTTKNGSQCVDWNGEFGYNGAMCRNPLKDEERPWCYIDDAHSERVFCDNQCYEPYDYKYELEAIAATLSGGPVAVGDKKESLNRTLLEKSMRKDGMLLQPTKPLTSVDSYFTSENELEYYTTDVRIDNCTFGVILFTEKQYSIYGSPSSYNLVDAFSTDAIFWGPDYSKLSFEVIEVGDSINSYVSYRGYYNVRYSSPIIPLQNSSVTDFALLGDISKWLPVAEQRIFGIRSTPTEAFVDVYGIEGESVDVSLYVNRTTKIDVKCLFTETGVMVLDVGEFNCA